MAIRWLLRLVVGLGLLGLAAGPARAVLSGAYDARLARLEQWVASLPAPAGPVNAGNNAWVLARCALVLLMTAPGFSLFYGGLVRSKNVPGTMMHSLILMSRSGQTRRNSVVFKPEMFHFEQLIKRSAGFWCWSGGAARTEWWPSTSG